MCLPLDESTIQSPIQNKMLRWLNWGSWFSFGWLYKCLYLINLAFHDFVLVEFMRHVVVTCSGIWKFKISVSNCRIFFCPSNLGAGGSWVEPLKAQTVCFRGLFRYSISSFGGVPPPLSLVNPQTIPPPGNIHLDNHWKYLHLFSGCQAWWLSGDIAPCHK